MKKLLSYLGIFIILGLITFSLFYLVNINSAFDKKGEEKIITIVAGTGLAEIAQQLKDDDLIQSKNLFVLYARNSGLQAKLQAGEYQLSSAMSVRSIARAISKGKANSQEVKVQFIEGWTTKEMSSYLENQGMWQSEELLELIGFPQIDYRFEKDIEKPKDYSDRFDFLKDKPDYYGLEGYLFPDTYLLYQDAEIEDLVIKMLENFDRKLTTEMREEIKRQGRSIHEVITMASLIEKEATIKNGNNTDAKIISGLFWDRIKNGQALESCASLAYILGEYKTQYSLDDTAIESPYNTYRNRDLPPTPVSNPGFLAIEAAVYPTYTNYNYFLSPVGSDETVFSVTYEEHLRNKVKYLP